MPEKLAIDGGAPVRSEPFPSWPPTPTPEMEAGVLQVLRSGQWGSNAGLKGEEFAARFAARHGAAHGLTVANATLGLFAALRAVGVRPGDEVIIPAYTFIATATAVLLAGARPVIADVDADSLLISPTSVAGLVTERTRAVVPVHLAGAPADVDELRRVLGSAGTGSGGTGSSMGIAIVEDAAQAHGAALRGRPVGSLAEVACFSFQSSKTMTAGEGGIILTDDQDLFVRVFSSVNVGRIPGGGWYEHPQVGWNMRMTEMQSALLLPQLDELDEQNRRCAENAATLTEEIADVPGVVPSTVPESVSTHGWHLFPMHLESVAFGGSDKNEIVRALQAEGIPVSAGYVALHQNEALQQEVWRLGGTPLESAVCPGAELAQDRTIWFPRVVLQDGDRGAKDAAAALAKVQAVLSGSERPAR